MGRRSKKDLLVAIHRKLGKGPATINEIAEGLKSNWDTVRANLLLLVDFGLVEAPQGDDKAYKLRSDRVLEGALIQENTLLNIPLTEQQLHLSRSFLYEVKRAWKAVTGSAPSRIQLQKTAVAVAQRVPELDASVPHGWYLYGCMCLLQEYDNFVPSAGLPELQSKRFKEAVVTVVKEYEHLSIPALLRAQYDGQKRREYQLRLAFKDLLTKKMDAAVRKSLSEVAQELLFVFNPAEPNEFTPIVTEALQLFVPTLQRVLLQKGDEAVFIIDECFEAVWQLVGTHNLFDSLSGKYGFTAAGIAPYFRMRFTVLQQNLTLSLNTLSSLVEMPGFDLNKASSVGEKRKWTEDDRKKWAEELVSSDSSDLFRKFNLE